MVTIRCSVYEKRDFEVFLDYAKDKLIEDFDNNKITLMYLNIELEKIKKLKERLQGKVKEDYQQTSVKYNRDHGTIKVRENDNLLNDLL